MNKPVVDIRDEIVAARIKLLFRQPFFGNIATRFKLQENSTWCKTAATDGLTLYYNTEFFQKMTFENIIFVIAHEVLHMVFNHMDRKQYRMKTLWNYACDYAVNGILIRDRIGSPPKVDYLYDSKYDGKSAEEIYELLLEEYGNPDKIQGSLLDDHIEWDVEPGDGNSDDGDRPFYSAEQMEEMRSDIVNTIIQAVQCAAGKVPGEVLRLVNVLTEPKMDWRKTLQTHIQSLLKNDFTWTRPSRKSWHTNFIMPGVNYDQTIDVAVALDLSGSIGDEQVREFLSEVKGIMDEFKDFKLDLWTFDTKVYGHATFTADNSEELLSYQAMGGGGTNFVANWTFMKENGIEPKKFIMFTDGYCDSEGFGDPDYCDTLFIMYSDVVAPFGDTVKYQ
jgi:predicted metal-dependent peptidase